MCIYVNILYVTDVLKVLHMWINIQASQGHRILEYMWIQVTKMFINSTENFSHVDFLMKHTLILQ